MPAESYVTPAIRLDESGMWVLRKYHEAEVERLCEALGDLLGRVNRLPVEYRELVLGTPRSDDPRGEG